MSRNGSGTYSLPAGNPVITNTTISSTWANTTLADIATALTGSLATDGQTTATGNLQMGNNKIVNLDDGTNAADAVNLAQLTAAISTAISGVSGRILQTVTSQFTTTSTTASSSFVSTGHTVSITPTSATSKILVLQSGTMAQPSDSTPSANSMLTIYRNSTNLAGSNGIMGNVNIGYTGSIYASIAVSLLDAPATTSATVYTVYYKNTASGQTIYNYGFGAQLANLTVLEISA